MTGNWHAIYTVGCLMNVVAALLGFFVLRPVINARLTHTREFEAAVAQPLTAIRA